MNVETNGFINKRTHINCFLGFFFGEASAILLLAKLLVKEFVSRIGGTVTLGRFEIVAVTVVGVSSTDKLLLFFKSDVILRIE